MLTSSIVLVGLIAWKLKKVWVVSIAGTKKVFNIRINHTNVLKIFRKIWRFFLFFLKEKYRCNKGRCGYPYCVLKRNKGVSWQAYCVSQRAYYAGSSNKENGSGGESALPVFCFSVVTSSRCHGFRVTHWICLCYVRDNSVTTKWRIKICCHAGKCLFTS